jgi:hypothetical protein
VVLPSTGCARLARRHCVNVILIDGGPELVDELAIQHADEW